MTPKEYEDLICSEFCRQGYKAEVTPYSGDYGVDVFATKGKEKLAIQAKMYGQSTRKINRQMVMELHGAKDYFGCSKAVLITNGKVMTDAIEVAEKLKIEIRYFYPEKIVCVQNTQKYNDYEPEDSTVMPSFDCIWEKYIQPLKGKALIGSNGRSNTIVDVDWAKITRITSNGRKGSIKIEAFKQTINILLEKGCITREEINQNYPGRASSGIVLILSQVPFFEVEDSPKRLVLKNEVQ